MKKGEMEQHHREYHRLMSLALPSERRGDHRNAVELARQAFSHVDGMMRYAQKYDNEEFESVEAIDLVLRYAPALIDQQSLLVVEELLRKSRRIEKNTSDSLRDRLGESRERLLSAYRMWDYLEHHPQTTRGTLTRAPGVSRTAASSILDDWHLLGLVTLCNDQILLVTRLGAIVPGRCFGCGDVTSAPKAIFFEPLTCPSCGGSHKFAILGSKSD